MNYINSLEMGDTIYLTRLYPEIYSISGIDDVQITIGTNKSNLSANDIALDKFEAPSCTTNNVEVDING